jgi:hypothetical protein
MNQIRSRQITQLEKRAVPYIKQREGMAQQLRNLHCGAVAHAAVLAFVMRYGNPKMGEPLSEACRRVTESEAWKACCEKFPVYSAFKGHFPDENFFKPFTRDNVSSIVGDPLRHVLLSTLPGADEKDKLNRVFKSAPPWLIWFTFADFTAKLLDLNLPDLSIVTGFERSRDIFHGWWGFPASAFECHPWPHGTDQEPLARTDLTLLGLETKQDAPITNRERKRALANSARSGPTHQIDWPHLVSEEWLQLDFETRLARLREAGHFGGEEKRHPEFCGIDVTRRWGSIDY